MKVLHNPLLLLFMALAGSPASGQMSSFRYQRPLQGVTDTWHRIVVPDSVFAHASQDLRDLRIYGIGRQGDTLEVPYLLRVATDRITTREANLEPLNTSNNASGYYYTFEVPSGQAVNTMNLTFGRHNYDWRLTLEGSQDQREWFTLASDYRVVAIRNAQTDFAFNQLVFPRARYRYYRIRINSADSPALGGASLRLNDTVPGVLHAYPANQVTTQTDPDTRQTQVTISFNAPARLSRMEFQIADSFDYYRPIILEYLADSLQTPNGPKPVYRHLASGVLNSLEPHTYTFPSTTTQAVRFRIDNQQNPPLQVSGVKAWGYEHVLQARFTEPAQYFLVYGKEEAASPRYDIARFTDHIPDSLAPLSLGPESAVSRPGTKKDTALFRNKWWLWGIMGLVIVMLGGFTLSMMRKR